MPDTQYYTLESAYPETFYSQAQWVVDNKERLNIKGVLHVGDVVNYGNLEAEWAIADAAFDILETADVPYLAAIGNHDTMTNGARLSTLFNTNLPQSRYTEKSWWSGGFFEDGKSENAYMFITLGGEEYIIISMEFGARDSVLAWADGLLTTYAAKKAIILTHAYIAVDGTLLEGADTGSPYNYDIATDCNDGTEYWAMLKTHDNLRYVICGHLTPASNFSADTDGGKAVHQIMANYQNEDNGGNGWIRVMEFYLDAGLVNNKTYSTTLKETSGAAKDNFYLEIEP